MELVCAVLRMPCVHIGATRIYIMRFHEEHRRISEEDEFDGVHL